MFIILTYDVNTKRVAKVMKTCRKYLRHVQYSVFEGAITDGRLRELKCELESLVNPEEDAICMYRLDSSRYVRKEQMGIMLEEGTIL